MAKRRRLIWEIARFIIPLVILAGGVVGMFALSGQRELEPKEQQPVQAPLVSTVTAVEHDGTLDIEVDGVVVPYREITLSAEVDGRVIFKSDNCRAGRYVDKDTLLIEIDPRDYQLEARRLTHGVDKPINGSGELSLDTVDPESLIGLAEEELTLQRREFERLEKLADSLAVTESQIDQGKRSVLLAQNAVLTLRNQLEKAELNLSRTKIQLPVGGVIVNDSAEQGDYVRKGTPLVTMEDTSKVEIKCNLRMEELYWLWAQIGSADTVKARESGPAIDYEIPRTPVTVVYRLAGHEYLWDGILDRYQGIGLDEATRTVPCRVVVENPRAVRRPDAEPVGNRHTGPPALVRGMYVTVIVKAQPLATLLQLPEAAVRPGNKIWVARDGKLEIIEVRVVGTTGEHAVVQAGSLAPGDKVVVTPLAVATSGMDVREPDKS